MTSYDFAVEQLAELLKSPMPRDLAEYKRNLMSAVLIGQVMHVPADDPTLHAMLAEKYDTKDPGYQAFMAYQRRLRELGVSDADLSAFPSKPEPETLPAPTEVGEWEFRGVVSGGQYFSETRYNKWTFFEVFMNSESKQLNARGPTLADTVACFKGEWRKKG